MSSTAVELRNGAAPARIGQATAVEQSRAVAEVQAMVIVAQQMPRDIERAQREMQRSCGRMALAEKAFYRYPRGKKQVTGETIVLAKELARCWGNLDYGIAELRRDDQAGESEMMAFAWDLETNTRPRTTFIVPHVRDKQDGGQRLTESRDIYEHLTNMGNRRMREMIFNLMPPWFIDDAKDLCYKTLGGADGTPIAERAAKAAERFGKIGVRPEQLTQKLGAPQSAWSAADLAHLAVIFKSIERGETTAEDEFGTAPGSITAADLAPQNVPPAQPSSPPAAPQEPSPAGAGGTRTYNELLTYIGERLGELGVEDATEKLRAISIIAGTAVKSIRGLKPEEALKVADTLEGIKRVGPYGLLADLEQRGDGEPGGE